MLRLFLLLVLGNSALPLSAQANLQRRMHAPEYVLGAGDQVVLHVTDLDEISDKPIRVDPSGFIDLPLAGRVQASGSTLDEFKAELVTRLSKYIHDPSISVNLTESGNQPISVVGEVANPGVHQLGGSKRLLEMISLSGGLKPDAGPEIIVTREPWWGDMDAPHAKLDPATGFRSITIPVDSLMSGKEPDENILIAPNDVITIPKGELVYVVGDVHKAGGFALSTHTSVSVLHALTLAEGLGPDSAPKHAHILRPVPDGNGTPRDIPVDVDRILKGKAPDAQLLANDVLFIPHSGMKVTTRRAVEAAIGVSSGILIYR